MALSMIASALASNLKRLRADRSFTQEDLAARAGLSRTYVADIERGAVWVSPDVITKISAAFGCQETELFLDPDFIPNPSAKQILEAVNEAFFERSMLHELQRQGRVPEKGSDDWNRMVRVGRQNRFLIEKSCELPADDKILAREVKEAIEESEQMLGEQKAKRRSKA